MLPNLLVIGARKAGTTSLYHYLSEHPDVWMSPRKELRFFVAERNWPRGLDWYERFFPVAAPVRGEASPCYSEYPLHDGVPARIAALVPEAKLVYLVRDPIERMVSHWVMDHAMGWRPRPFLQEVADADHSRFALYGRYWMQLERYLEHFAPEQIRVIDCDALLTRRTEVMAGLFAFLGVDPAFASPERFRAAGDAHARRRDARASRGLLRRGCQPAARVHRAGVRRLDGVGGKARKGGKKDSSAPYSL
jgi:hypothetical protein